MKKFLAVILASAASLLFLTGATSAQLPWAKTRRSSGSFREGEVLVKPANHARVSSISGRMALASRHGAIQANLLGDSGLLRMKLAPGQKVEDMVARLSSDPDVEYAQPNFIYHTTAVPNDTSYGQLWALKNTGQTIAAAPYATHNPGISGKDVSAESAWTIATDCAANTVAVIDTGVNYNQTDLVANMWNGGGAYPNHGYDFVDSDNDPMDLNGHGTHVAGTIGAVGNNGSGTTGVCWTASLMAVRVLDAAGSGQDSDIILGINFAVAQGAKVINMSLGGSTYDAALNTAILNASNAGVVIVVAAGNDGTNNDGGSPTYPCNYTSANLICVAALDQSFALASFSNYGATSVDVGAPGTNIKSTWNGTQTTVSETFGAGWTVNGATWAHQSLAFSGTTYDVYSNPAAWNGTSTTYANNANAQAYKSYNLAGVDSASLSYYAFIDTEDSTDFFNTYIQSAGADPFAGAGTQLDQQSGTTGGYAVNFAYDLKNCLTATCNIGLQLTSNATVVNYGVAVLLFTIEKTVLNATSYNTISGTSMATPIVAGIAALVRTYNPNYTAADVVASVKNGGVAAAALSGKSTTGKAANMLGSLSYITTPTGVTASVQ
ncbi:MAG: S8 family serine peptidase [Bdellovibrionota bacterium]